VCNCEMFTVMQKVYRFIINHIIKLNTVVKFVSIIGKNSRHNFMKYLFIFPDKILILMEYLSM
jgi:hypothetical protein